MPPSLFEWFSNNQMKANPDKCHLLTCSMTPFSINIKGHIINNSKFEKLLGVTFDCKLNFNVHLDNVQLLEKDGSVTVHFRN